MPPFVRHLAVPPAALDWLDLDLSWDSRDAERGKRAGGILGRELFFLLQISHKQIAAFVIEAEVIHAKHVHAKADLRADRIQIGIECLFGDAEIR